MKPSARRLLFGATLVLGPCVLALLALELALRLGGFGYATAPLVRWHDGQRDWLIGNPDFTRLYFPAALKRLPPPNRVVADKPAGARRYMVVGGSAAAGDPDTDFSIARNLEWILTTTHPDVRWEVLNLAYTACNSHVAAEVVRQSAGYGLDGVIVLVGNNEVIGPFGPGTTPTAALPSAAWGRWQVRLRKLRIGQLGQAAAEALRGRDGREQWRGMEQFLGHRIAADDPRLQRVYANYRANLEAIGRTARARGMAALLATVPVNLLDQPPFLDDSDQLPEPLRAELSRWNETGESSLDLAALAGAAAAHPGSASLAYMAGCVLFEAGRREEADALLGRARDLDQLRFRADSRINAIIREQWTEPGAGWLAVDAETPLLADHPRQALGYPHFYEHVHFTFRANFLIARAMARAILEHENLDTNGIGNLDWSAAAEGLGYTSFEAWNILGEIGQRLGRPPFTAIPGYARRCAWIGVLRAALGERVSGAGEKRRANGAYLAAIAARPDDYRLKLKFAKFLAANGRPAEAHAIVAEIFPLNPADSDLAMTFLTLSIQLGLAEPAHLALARAESIFPEHPSLPELRGKVAGLRKSGK